MKSIKPGRGPSGMNFVASLFGIAFGVFWTVIAFLMVSSVGGALWLFPLFGLLFIGMGIAQAVYSYRNATGKNRYSAFDITEDGEEPDPLDPRCTGEIPPRRAQPRGEAGFCPYCGAKAEKDYAFCRCCGKRLPGA